ncbi:hypothetical protein TCAL_12242 [Tigriopus californicus]|uniref:Uncharacterized protein n=1 Tax=Tigriopus californicus TaxID=6832 RepID=A0A553N7I6_TIGCA|nr:hypothetical protein TCAL_12242 [Tigriopus californicus]|eukprot:TCALIF_12242-PA protein Name:"Protein of unknown function" AED:0.06 eAED:0.06 QI:117/0.75/0.6/0.8/0.5/0.4/5/0/213
MIHPRTSILSSAHSILLRADNHHIKNTDMPLQTSNLSHPSSVSAKVIMASAAPAMLKRWAKSLGLNEDDVKLLHESSKLTNPVGFLMFLSKVSKNKDAFKLTVEQLQGIKEEIMTQKVDIPDNQTLCPTKKSERLSCSLSLACNSNDESSNLPRQFDTNKKIKKQVKKPIKSHQNKMISSFKSDINNLWDRRFPQDRSNIARTSLSRHQHARN